MGQVHRLPVVNEGEEVVGIVTRVDIFEPLMPGGMLGDPLYRMMSKPDQYFGKPDQYFGLDFKSD